MRGMNLREHRALEILEMPEQVTLEDIIETILGLEIIDENDQATDMQQFARERWERRQKRFRTIVLPKEDDKSQA